MPEISRFFGIVIFMNYNDHEPPHFKPKFCNWTQINTDICKGLKLKPLPCIFHVYLHPTAIFRLNIKQMFLQISYRITQFLTPHQLDIHLFVFR